MESRHCTQLSNFDQGLDRLISGLLAEAGIPGAAVAISLPGQELIGTYGYIDATRKAPVGPDTAFDIGSCSKAFIATAIALLASMGRLGWDDPVRKHLPDFELDEKDITETVTIRDLLCNRIGLRRQIPVTAYSNPDIPVPDILRRLPQLDRVYPFRKGYVYFNPGFMACVQIVERITGLSYADFLEKELLSPIGMVRTASGLLVEDTLPGRASGHTYIGGKPDPIPGPVYHNLEGAGAVYSSAMDAIKWMKFHLDGGRVENHTGPSQLINAEILAQTHQAHTPIPVAEYKLIHRPPEAGHCDYCMGWWLTDFHGEVLLQHAGEAVGWRTMVALLPERKMGVSVYLSAAKGIHQAISYTVLETLLTGHSRDWAELVGAECEAIKSQIEQQAAASFPSTPGVHTSVSLEKLTGLYRHGACGDAVVSLADEELEMRLADGRLWDTRLKHLGNDVFECRLLRPAARDFMPGAWRARFEVQDGKVLWLEDINARYERV